MTVLYRILCILNPRLFVWHLSSFQLRPDYHGLWWRDSRTIVGTVGKPWSWWWWCFCFLPHDMPPVITCSMVKWIKPHSGRGTSCFMPEIRKYGLKTIPETSNGGILTFSPYRKIGGWVSPFLGF